MPNGCREVGACQWNCYIEVQACMDIQLSKHWGLFKL